MSRFVNGARVRDDDAAAPADRPPDGAGTLYAVPRTSPLTPEVDLAGLVTVDGQTYRVEGAWRPARDGGRCLRLKVRPA